MSQNLSRDRRLACSGECEKPGTLDIDELLRRFDQEERIYRFLVSGLLGFVTSHLDVSSWNGGS